MWRGDRSRPHWHRSSIRAQRRAPRQSSVRGFRLPTATICLRAEIADILRELLFDAASDGDLAGVQAELDKGADVNAKNKDGWTPLNFATDGGHKEVAELLIANGADVNAKDDQGSTPLKFAAYRGQKEIVELLIAEGADVNAKDDEGGTPLHLAAWRGHKETAELLIAEGADANAKIEAGKLKGQTPLDLAVKYKQTEIADLLRKHGGKTKKELKAEGK